jgi:hypothetical protein
MLSGVLMGMTNGVGTIPGFAVPAFVGALTHSNVSSQAKISTLINQKFLPIN